MKYSRLKKAAVPIKANILFFNAMGTQVGYTPQVLLPFEQDQIDTFWNNNLSDTDLAGRNAFNAALFQGLVPSNFPQSESDISSITQTGDIITVVFNSGDYAEVVYTGGW